MSLTKEQVAAVTSPDKYIFVRAGAGTGKTEVLTRRILNLLSQDSELSLSDLAVITFTNKATENLQSRLKSYLYREWLSSSEPVQKNRYRYLLEELNSANISTIHSFCRSILDLAGPFHMNGVSYANNYSVANSVTTTAIDKAMELWLEKFPNHSPEHVKILQIYDIRKIAIETYEMLRARGISVTDVINQTRQSALLEPVDRVRKLKSELSALLELLQHAVEQSKVSTLDTDDLLEYCYILLRNRPDVVNKVKAKFKHIFVDEFQDTSAYQTGIIRMICDGSEDSPSLFVVGDYKQSIYQFRGADLRSYESAERWIEGNGVVLPLRTNFRSSPELVQLINYVFDHIAVQFPYLSFRPDHLSPKDPPSGPIDITTAYDFLVANESYSQHDLVVQYIRSLQQPLSNVAILFRTNHSMVKFSEALIQASIPYRIVGAGDYFNQREIVDAVRVMKYLVFPKTELSRQEALSTLIVNGDQSTLSKLEQDMPEDPSVFTPAQLLDFIFSKTHIRPRFSRTAPQVVANLYKLKDLARELSSNEQIQHSQFINWLTTMILSKKDEAHADVPMGPSTDAVTLITIHKAKGLEFPIVILPQLDRDLSSTTLRPSVILNKNLGLEFRYEATYEPYSVASNNYEETLKQYNQDLYSEELRVLYVAMTRAMNRLVLIGDSNCPKTRICYQNWLASCLTPSSGWQAMNR
jgi:DNA helicase-2/ATP-dependent DNA helicase PcrA